MKKITLFLILCLLYSYTQATVIVDEIFDYASASLASEPTWTTSGTLTTGTGRNIVTPALSYSNLGGTYILSELGKAINSDLTSTSNYVNIKALPSTLNSGVVYMSYLFKAGVVQSQTAVEIFGFSSGTGAGPRIWVGKTANSGYWKFGISRSSTANADVSWNSVEFNDVNEVVLLVMKYDFSTLTASFYINPTLDDVEPETPAASNNNGTGRTSLNNLWFRAQGSSMFRYIISGARVSTTWAEAVAVKSTADPLPAPVIGSASSITADGFSANWTSVANAIGYDVKVYMGTNLISTSNASGQETESLAISGLMSGITYTYRVIAKGDVDNFSDSDPSAASDEITTLDPYATNTIHTDFGDETWGEIATSLTSGSYGSHSVNGFDLVSASLFTGTTRGIKGETHTNRIAIDKLSTGGSVYFPTVNSVEQIEIHAVAGTAGNGFQLKEFIPSTNSWAAIGGTYVYNQASKDSGLDSIYIISISRAEPSKFRIDNPTNGTVYITQIITRTTNPVLLEAPVVGVATAVNSTHFTTNWTAVANATGYVVRVYQGTSNVKTIEVPGQAVESVQVSGLTAETEYTYKVQAIGDNYVDYADSFLSAVSAPVTTGITSGLESLSALKLTVSGKTIMASESGMFEVYNMQGAKLHQVKNTVMTVTNLPAGLYILQFTGVDGKQTTKKISIN